MNLVHKFLMEAIQGETQAQINYAAYSKIAQQEGFLGVAALFSGLSRAEEIHIGNHIRALEKNGLEFTDQEAPKPVLHESSKENIQAAIQGEKAEFSSMYPGFLKQIKKKHGKEFFAKVALLSIEWAMDAEKNHHQFLVEAKRNPQGLDPSKFYLCAVCGNLEYADQPPQEICPVCKHDPSFYDQVEMTS